MTSIIIFRQNWSYKVGIFLSLKFLFVSARFNDAYDYYDSSYIRQDYLSKYCWQNANAEDLENFKTFKNCTKPGLAFQNISDDITAEELYEKNRIIFENWCSSWESQRTCEKSNEIYLDKCFKEDPSISVGFDLLTAFFESACSKTKENPKERGESLPYLIILRHKLKTWWYNERDVVSCFNQMSLEFYRRDINMVLACLQYQLRYRYCNFEEQSCKTLLNKIRDEVKASYSSSGYVYLINLNLTFINTETFPLATEMYANNNCQHAKYAYIAFFSLLTLVLITLGVLVSVKVNCLNLPCYREHEELMQDDNSNVEL